MQTELRRRELPLNRASCRSEFHPSSAMSRADARSRKQLGGFWRNQTFNSAAWIDQVWIESCHSHNQAENGGLVSLMKNSCHYDGGLNPTIAVLTGSFYRVVSESRRNARIKLQIRRRLIEAEVPPDVDLQVVVQQMADRSIGGVLPHGA